MLKSSAIWLWVITFTPVLFSCITHNRQVCRTVPPDQIIQVKIAEFSREFKVWTGGNSANQDPGYSYASNPTTTTEKEMVAASDYYGLDVRPLLRGNQLASLVFYAASVLEDKVLQQADLLGILVYIRVKNRFILHEYVYKNGVFTKIEAPVSRTKHIFTNDIHAGASTFKPAPAIIAFKLQDISLLK